MGDVSARFDKHIADMVNHVFDKSNYKDKYKEILDHSITKRPSKCHALAPVKCKKSERT